MPMLFAVELLRSRCSFSSSSVVVDVPYCCGSSAQHCHDAIALLGLWVLVLFYWTIIHFCCHSAVACLCIPLLHTLARSPNRVFLACDRASLRGEPLGESLWRFDGRLAE
jgi:hypothetical protein